VARALGIASLVLAGWLVLWLATDVVLLAFIALLLAVALATPAAAIAKRSPLSHALALALVVASLVATVAAGLWVLGEQVVQQLEALIADLPALLERLQLSAQRIPGGAFLLERLDEVDPLELADPTLVGQAAGFLGGLVDVAVRVAFVVFLALFLAAKPATYREGLVRLVPHASQRRARTVLDGLGKTLQGWVLGQLVSMLLVGSLVSVTLLLLGVPYALLLGLFAGLAELVPLFGPLFAYIPTVIVAFFTDPTLAIWVTALWLVIQVLEGNVIQPMVQRWAVDLPMALTVIAVLLGGTLFGPLGYFIGTPLMALVLVAVKMLYLHDVRGQHVELPGGNEEG
jgi:predicted PurR-regulated permease PerM